LESSQQRKEIHIEVDPNLDSDDDEENEIENKNGEKELKNKMEEHIAMEVMAKSQGQHCSTGPMWLLYLHKVIR
jgi:predicted flavoprotein YhiN